MDLFSNDISLNTYDAIIIPGAGGPRDGLDPVHSIPEWVKCKLDWLIKYHRCVEPVSKPVVLLSAGTFHKPGSLDCNGRNFQECTAMTLYLEHHNFPLELVYEENASYDTVGNAYFLRTMHTEVTGWRKLLVICNQFHYHRLKLIFDWVFGLPRGPARDQEDLYQLHYAYFPDSRLGREDAIDARRKREISSYGTMSKRIQDLNITSLTQFHGWLFHSHDLYRSNNRKPLVLTKPVQQVNDQCLKSY